MLKADVLVVGAGFAGLVMAERLSSQLGLTCIVVDRRAHIGGNSADAYDSAGVLYHKYGPHYFRTNSQKIRDYLSKFTEWQPARYEILSSTQGRFWNFPVNLNTYEQIIGRPSSEQEFQRYLEAKRTPIARPANSEEVIISQVGWELYEMFFKGYTLKQWKLHPKDLDPSVCGRIPIRTNRDNRYLSEEFQALPKDGYHKLFERMADATPRLKLLLETDYRDLLPHADFRHMIYTGPVDEYFGQQFGPLPYRSLSFEHRSYSREELAAREPVAGKSGFWQPAVQINYPNDHAYTRTVEVKHITRQNCANTSVVFEYPDEYGPGKEPYYPVPNLHSAEIYSRYAQLAAREENVSFIGRLATYKYYNMDQVVGMALHEFDKLSARWGMKSPGPTA